MHDHVAALFPFCRSITGAGLRETLAYIDSCIGLDRHEVPTGTQVLDWQVPPEWVVRGARIETLDQRTIVDFADCNLHLVQYSHPVDGVLPLADLQPHLHSLPDQPALIPYRTSYYNSNWGFCLPHERRLAMTDPEYRVRVDTELRPGSLSYGEAFIPGRTAEEFLISVHCCHPSLANDNLSSIAVAIELARQLRAGERPRYGYRFVFVPGTIGAITWLHFNRDAPQRVRHGLVLSCLGDPAPFTYKQSRRGNAPVDRWAGHLLGSAGTVLPFEPYGYDERQYCSPGFNLPVGCLMRSRHGTFPEYHTSADNLRFVTPDALADSLAVVQELVAMAEADHTPLNLFPFGEPQLGRRKLYGGIGGGGIGDGAGDAGFRQLTLLWVLNQADGTHSLLDIAERSGEPFAAVAAAAAALTRAGLLGAAAG